jgi:uncharacterized protein (DUF58 family)
MSAAPIIPVPLDRRRNALYLVIVGSLLTGFITGRGVFFNVAYVFIGLMFFSFVWARTGATWLTLTRRARPRRAQLGRYLEEQFTLRNSGPLPKLWIELHDQSDLPGHRASHVVAGLRRSSSWTVRTLCLQRGVFRLGPVRLMTGDPFGLYESQRQIDATTSLIVYPAIVNLPTFDLPPGVLPGGDAVRRRTHQITTNAAGVREYVPGDSFNRIHWRSTARRDRLMVKEFELDPLADVWIMLDAERRVQAGHFSPEQYLNEIMPWEGHSRFSLPPTTEEYCVTITASLAQHFLRRDRAIGMVAHGQRHQVIQVDRGQRQLLKILENLALLRARGTMTLEQLLVLEGDQLARGTTLIVVTPSVRDTWVQAAARLRRRGVNVVGVSVDAGSFGGQAGADRITALLAVNGIPWRIVRRDDDLALALANTRL